MTIPILGPIIDLADNLFKVGVTAMDGWQKRMTARQEAEIAAVKAATETNNAIALKAQDGEINWDLIQAAAMGGSWKDEFYVLVFSTPLIMSFVPGLDVYVGRGFAVLGTTPEWYQWALAIMVSASFGYRKFADFWSKK